jgi:hypothetical protein
MTVAGLMGLVMCLCLQLAEDFVAVHVGHHDVEQDQVGFVIRLGNFQRALAIRRQFDPVHAAQQVAHQ